jgi:hypothetical protein
VTAPERPKAGDPPDLTRPTEVLRYLLAIEAERLQVALSIERKRELVFPETTVIVRDIERLTAELERRDAEAAGAAGAAAQKGAPEKTAQSVSGGWAPADLPSLGD